jgi:hypothetical protein
VCEYIPCRRFVQTASPVRAVMHYLSVCQIRASPPFFLPLRRQLPPSFLPLSCAIGGGKLLSDRVGAWETETTASALLSFYLQSFSALIFSRHSLFTRRPKRLNQVKATPCSPNLWRPRRSSSLLAPTLMSHQSDALRTP